MTTSPMSRDYDVSTSVKGRGNAIELVCVSVCVCETEQENSNVVYDFSILSRRTVAAKRNMRLPTVSNPRILVTDSRGHQSMVLLG